LNEVCDSLQSFQKTVIHTTEQQMTYLHKLDETTKVNAKATLDLGRALRDSIKIISLGLRRVEADIIDMRFASEKQAKYSTAIREIESVMKEIKCSLIQLQESLDLTSVGKLGSTLINPYNLPELLQQVNLHLPKGTSMSSRLSTEDMYIYWSCVKKHVRRAYSKKGTTKRTVIAENRLPLAAAMYHLDSLQLPPNQPQTSQVCNQQNQLPYNLQFPPLQTTLTATNQPQPSQPHQPICQQVQPAYISTTHVNQIPSLMQPNISNPRSGADWSNEDDLEMSNRETLRKHQWQTVNNKRRRICSQTPANITTQIHTTNRFESLCDSTCDISQNGMSTNLKTPNTTSKEPKPPPIYIYRRDTRWLDTQCPATANTLE
jgi:hypothetical protein